MNIQAVVLMMLVLALAPAAHAGDDACGRLAELDWLLGTWRAQSESRLVTESWWRVSPDTFEGRGRTESRTDGATAGSETLRLVQMQGAVFYLAMVDSNALPVAFRLTECTAGSARFENPQHDFPRRLDYSRQRPPAEQAGQTEHAVHDAQPDVLVVDVSDAAGKGFTLRFERSAGPADVAPHGAPTTDDEAPVEVKPR